MRKEFQDWLAAAGRFLILVGILIAVGLFSAYLGMRFAVRGTEVEVPSIIGKGMSEAESLLRQYDLRIEVIGDRFDTRIPEEGIISQYPEPGDRIKAQGAVQVIVSLGEKKNPVPKLKGSPIRVARLVASQAGFQLGNIGEISLPGVPREMVVEQHPAPNSENVISPVIDVLVSTGASPGYVMPGVVGESLNRILPLFQRNGFDVGKIQYGNYSGLSRGTIVKQFPEPGHQLKRDQSINLEVAR